MKDMYTFKSIIVELFKELTCRVQYPMLPPILARSEPHNREDADAHQSHQSGSKMNHIGRNKIVGLRLNPISAGGGRIGPPTSKTLITQNHLIGTS